MMPISSRLTLLCALLLHGQPIRAQEQIRTAPQSEIVVTGTRDVDRQLNDFVRALAPARSTDQLARFETAVCPAALGFSPAHRAAIEERLRSVAGAAGLEVALEGCSVNALVMVADEKQALMKALRDRHPRYLGNLTPTETRRLIRAPGPTASWQLEGAVTARGTPVDVDHNEGAFLNPTTESPSRITAPTRPVFHAAALVIERGALAGLTTTQLADYSAMRLFARIDPARLTDPTVPTIVTILDAPMDSEVPLALTHWDLGFLRGLYAITKNVYSGAQRAEIVRHIGRELIRTGEKR